MLLEKPLADASPRLPAGRQAASPKSATGRRWCKACCRSSLFYPLGGVALMCLAEALLRIPDKPTRHASATNGNGNWHSHLGRSPSMFVNAATWGAVHRPPRLHPQTKPVAFTEPHYRQERRTADLPQRRGYGDAPDGNSSSPEKTIAEALVSHASWRRSSFPLLLRYAGRSASWGAGCESLPALLRAGYFV